MPVPVTILSLFPVVPLNAVCASGSQGIFFPFVVTIQMIGCPHPLHLPIFIHSAPLSFCAAAHFEPALLPVLPVPFVWQASFYLQLSVGYSGGIRLPRISCQRIDRWFRIYFMCRRLHSMLGGAKAAPLRIEIFRREYRSAVNANSHRHCPNLLYVL